MMPTNSPADASTKEADLAVRIAARLREAFDIGVLGTGPECTWYPADTDEIASIIREVLP
jgi:hypothetical protein